MWYNRRKTSTGTAATLAAAALAAAAVSVATVTAALAAASPPRYPLLAAALTTEGEGRGRNNACAGGQARGETGVTL